MNINLAMSLCLANKEKNKPFDDYVAGIANRMLENSPQEKTFLEAFDVHYYLADHPEDVSIARVVNADSFDDRGNLRQGTSFGVVLNKEWLQKLDSEDALAFVIGHELSHIMYQKGHPQGQDLSKDEETCCDLIAVQMMHAGGFNLLEITKVNDLYPQKTMNMYLRMGCRHHFMEEKKYNPLARLGLEKPLRKELFAELVKESWQRENLFAQGEVGVEQIVAELGDIYQRGDNYVFVKGFDAYLSGKTTEESSKLIMSVLADVMPKFTPIEEVRAQNSYTKYRNHPVAVMSNIVMSQFAREGKKLLPPQDLAVVNQYMQQNRDYFENRDKKLWAPLVQIMPQNNMIAAKVR